MLRDEDNALDIICDKITSKDYWIFITDSIGLLEIIENKFYKPKTEANVDFELMFTPGLVSVAIAHKRRMSFEQMHELFSSFVDQRTMNELDKRHVTNDIDLFVVPIQDGSSQMVFDIMFKLQGHLIDREIKIHGLEYIIGTECQYRYTILAEQEGEQHLR